MKHIINDGQMETFVREVKSLSHIKHPNLVSLLGHCDGDDECFLIFELCHNGNLSQWLFGMLCIFPTSLKTFCREKFSTDFSLLCHQQEKKILYHGFRGCILQLIMPGVFGFCTQPGGCIVHRDIKVDYICTILFLVAIFPCTFCCLC